MAKPTNTMSGDDVLKLYGIGTEPVVEKPGFISSNLKKGFATTGQAIGGLGKFLGAEDTGQTTVDYWKRKAAEYEQADPTLKFSDINGIGDATKFVGQQTLQMAPLALTAVPATVAGASLAPIVGGSAAVGGGIGAALGSIGTEAGIISSDVDPGKMDRGQILKGAIPAGLLETIPELVGLKVTGLGKTAIKMLEKKYGKEVAAGVTEKAIAEGWGSKVPKILGGLGAVMASEGATESAQSPLEEWGAGKQVFKDGQSFMDAPVKNTIGAFTGSMIGGENYTPEMQENMFESGAAGAAGGLGMAGGGHLVNAALNYKKPVVVDDKTSMDVTNNPNVNTPDIDTQIKSALGASAPIYSNTNAPHMDLFGGVDSPNFKVPQQVTPQDVVRMQQTGPSEASYDPYNQPLWNHVGQDVQTPEQATKLTQYNTPEQKIKVTEGSRTDGKGNVVGDHVKLDIFGNPELDINDKAPVISKALDPIFHQSMLNEIKAAGGKTGTNMEDPSAVQRAVEKVYKKYKGISEAALHPIDGLSTEETHNKAVRNKAMAMYVTQTMETSPEFKQYPAVQKALEKQGTATELGGSNPTVDATASMGDNTENDLFNYEEPTQEVNEAVAPESFETTTEQPTQPTLYDEVPKVETPLIKEPKAEEVVAEEVPTEVKARAERRAKKKSAFSALLEETDSHHKDKIIEEDGGGKRAPDGSKASHTQAYGRVVSSPELRKNISSLVDKLTGGNAAVEFTEGGLVRTDKAGKKVTLDGETIGAFIRLAADSPNIKAIARHESIHVLRNMGVISDAEWNILKAKANKWIKEFNVKADYPNLNQEELIEEAVARAFQNESEKSTVFGKIKEFFEKLINLIKGNKFESAKEVFSKVESGEIGNRPFGLITTDSISKPAKARPEFVGQFNKVKEGISEPLNETIQSLHDNKVDITYSSIKGNMDKLIEVFEPAVTKPIQDMLNKYIVDLNVFSPLVDPKTREPLNNPRVFKTFKAYADAFDALLAEYKGDTKDTPLEFGNKKLGISINTLGEFQEFVSKYKATHKSLIDGFKNRNFEQYEKALESFEEMGFAPYKQGKRLIKFFNRTAAIQMYTFYHYGTISEVLLPEWFVYADDNIKANLPKYKEIYEKHANMYYGMGDAAHNVDKQTVGDLVNKSQMIKDLKETMYGKNSDVFVMRGYNATDRNFVAMQVARVLQQMGVVHFSDKFGDAMSKHVGKKGLGGFNETDVTDTIFANITNNSSFEEFMTAFGQTDEGIETNNDYDINEEEGSSLDEESRNLSEDENPTLKGKHKQDSKGFDPEMLAMGVGNQPKQGTNMLAHKDDFKVAGAPNAAEVLLDRKSHVLYLLSKLDPSLVTSASFEKAVANYKANNNREQFINSIIDLVTKGIADAFKTSVDGHISKQTVEKLENVKDGLNINMDFSNDPFLKFMNRRSDYRSISDDKAPVPYSFALNQMAEALYKERSKQGGDTSKSKKDQLSAKENALQKLALVVTAHWNEFGAWPFYVRDEASVKTIMKFITEQEGVGVPPIAGVVMDSTKESQLRQILLRQLGFEDGDSRQPLYAQIKKEVAENRKAKKNATNVKMIPKKIVAEKLTTLIGNLLTGTNEDGSRDFESDRTERALRTYLQQIENGLLFANVKSDIIAKETLSTYLRSKLAGNMGKPTVDNIFKLVKSIAGPVPMISEATYTPTPSIDLGAIFENYKNMKKADKATISTNWLPKINEMISDLVNIDVSTRIVTDKKGNSQLQIFADSLGSPSTIEDYNKVFEGRKAQLDEVVAETRKQIFEKEDMSFTHVRKLTAFMSNLDIAPSPIDKMTRRGIDTTTLKQIKQGRTEEPFANVSRGEASPQAPYVSVKADARHTGEDTRSEGSARIAKFVEDKINVGIKRFVDLKASESMTRSFIEGYVDMLNYTVNGVDAPRYLKEARDEKMVTIEQNLKEIHSEDSTWIQDYNASEGITSLPLTEYSKMITQLYSDLNQFMYGENNQPVQDVWKNKTTGETVISELSTSGLVGNEQVRYYKLGSNKSSIRTMSVEQFKKQFKQIEMPQEELSTKPDEEGYLSEYASSKMNSDFENALRDVPEAIADKLRYAFFEDESFVKSITSARNEAKNIGAGEDGTAKARDLGKAINKQAFSAETILKGMLDVEKRLAEEKSGNKMLKATYEYPDLYKAIKTALEGLQDAGFLSPSFASDSEKMQFTDQAFISKKKGASIGVAKGRKYIFTEKMFEMMSDAHNRIEDEKALKTKASVWQDTMKPFVDDSGSFKDMFRDAKKLFPIGTKEFDIVKSLQPAFEFMKNIFKVPYYTAKRIPEFMDMMLTSMRRNEFSDIHKTNFRLALHDEFVKGSDLAKNNPEEYKKLSELITYADALGENFNKKQAQEKIGFSEATYQIFKDLKTTIEKELPSRLAMAGASAYMAKFQGIFKNETLAVLAYNLVGEHGGSLSTEEVRSIAKQNIPTEIKDAGKWGEKFVNHLVSYNQWLGDTKQNMSKVANWMPRVRKIDKFFVEAFEDHASDPDKKGRKVAFKYFTTFDEAKAWLAKIEAKDPSEFKYDVPKGKVTGKVQDTSTHTLGLFSTLDSTQEFSEILEAFDGDLGKAMSSPAFGNTTLKEGEAGSKHLQRRLANLVIGYDTTDAYQNYLTALDRMAMSFGRLEYGLTQFGNLKRVEMQAVAKPELNKHIPDFVKHLKYDLQRATWGDNKAQQFKSVVALYFMGFRLLSSVVNSTQPFISGSSELAKSYGAVNGKGSASNQVQAIKDLARWIKIAGNDAVANYLKQDESFVGKATYKALAATFGEFNAKEDNMPAEHKRAINKFSKTGIMRGMFNDMTFGANSDDAFFERAGGKSGVFQSITDNALKWFQITEIINREGSFLAAFDHHLTNADSKLSDLEKFDFAYKEAEKYVYDSQYMVNKFNMPLSFKDMGAPGTAMYGLMSFPFNMLNQMVHHMGNAVNGDFDSAKVIIGMLGVIFLLGGADALPFKDLVEFLYKHLIHKGVSGAGVKGITGDLDTDAKRLLTTLNTPDAIQNLFMGGVPTAAGVNISGNLGMKTPLIGGMFGGKSAAESVTGASGAFVNRFIQGGTDLSRGDMWKAFENMTPEAVASMSRAARMYSEGQKTKTGTPVYYKGKPVKESAGEAIAAGFGLKTQSWADKQSARNEQRSVKVLWDERKQLALASGDIAEIRRFNSKLLKAKIMPLVTPINGLPKAKPKKSNTSYELSENNKTID